MGELGHHVKLNHSDTERQNIIVALVKYNLKNLESLQGTSRRVETSLGHGKC